MFSFKQFTIDDSRCAMKVGTDGVLLGAWASTGSRILDIGTGSGLIALMLAQRVADTAQIDAIDIDPEAVEQAEANFVASPWSTCQAYLSSLQDWATAEREGSYDLIVSNPPYFDNSLKNPDTQRSLARHTDTLSYEELIACSVSLLAEDGHLCLILPIEAERGIIELATKQGLRARRVMRVKGVERKPYKRILLDFAKSAIVTEVAESELILTDKTGARTTAYASLCRDFYL